MAKQKGIFKLKGTIGDVTFYKTRDGHIAKEKSGVDAKRIANDPAFERTRENGREFGTAGKGGQLIRKGLRLLLLNAKDSRVGSRLLKALMTVIKTDAINDRGQRTIQDGDMSLLKGFDFNVRGKLGTALFSGYTTTFDRAAGTLEVALEAFTPQITIEAPTGTTHFEVVGGLCATDFTNRTFEEGHALSGILPWDHEEVAGITLNASIGAGSVQPVLTVVGVNFYQDVNGKMYPLKNGTFNALGVVDVDQL
tara:strand:+ start:14928 stop:15683 length:756 start_codon:yes stop_codon:yes gene_type:complete